MRWRAVGDAIVRAALAASPRDRGIVATIVGLLIIFFGPTMYTLRNPAPIGRTIWGVKRRLERDLPIGTSMDSAVAYLNRVGIVEVTALDPTFKGAGVAQDIIVASRPSSLPPHRTRKRQRLHNPINDNGLSQRCS